MLSLDWGDRCSAFTRRETGAVLSLDWGIGAVLSLHLGYRCSAFTRLGDRSSAFTTLGVQV